jgi:hypothetical protein
MAMSTGAPHFLVVENYSKISVHAVPSAINLAVQQFREIPAEEV